MKFLHRTRVARCRCGGRSRLRSLFVALWLLPLDPVSAELRVLLVFDADGYRVERVVRGEASLIERLREHERGREPDTSVTDPGSGPESGLESGLESGPGEATLTWLDDNGVALAVERMPDPRVARVPAPGSRVGRKTASDHLSSEQALSGDVVPERVGLDQGSWIARGPDETTVLLLRLPADGSLTLAPDEWLLELDEGSPGQVRR